MKTKDLIKLMGKKVTVYKILCKKNKLTNSHYNSYYTKESTWEEHELDNPITGWFIGFRYVHNGKTRFDYNEGHIFEHSKSIPVILVTEWITKNPLKVPLDGYVYNEDENPLIMSPSRRSWEENSDQYKKEIIHLMKSEMKNHPRDEKGRWIKISKGY